jgi:hypothetical protein
MTIVLRVLIKVKIVCPAAGFLYIRGLKMQMWLSIIPNWKYFFFDLINNVSMYFFYEITRLHSYSSKLHRNKIPRSFLVINRESFQRNVGKQLASHFHFEK